MVFYTIGIILHFLFFKKTLFGVVKVVQCETFLWFSIDLKVNTDDTSDCWNCICPSVFNTFAKKNISSLKTFLGMYQSPVMYFKL